MFWIRSGSAERAIVRATLCLVMLFASAASLSAQHNHVPDPLGVSMDRLGSGTTWIPDAVTVPSRQFMLGGWNLMSHGFVFGQYNAQSGSRGDSQFGSLNWGMLMASHTLAGGRFQARTMLSLDPATVTKRGYPLLLQTGESIDGEPLRDRQHPHDFWMELGLMYERPIARDIGVLLYAAPSGEPALGPVAFMHRPSAMDNPLAPLSHHWQDATHISFGVLTAGVFGNRWKLEGSFFNGREPNEFRWDFDRITLDSYAGRLSINPSDNWAMSLGYGYLKSPEAGAPNESLRRGTASAIYGTPFGSSGQWSTAFVYGTNKHASGDAELSHSALLESELVADRFNTVFARTEVAQKSADDLGVFFPSSVPSSHEHFTVGAVSLGYVRELGTLWGGTLGLGVMGTLNVVPSSLRSEYGSRTPQAGMVFLRIRPVLTRDPM